MNRLPTRLTPLSFAHRLALGLLVFLAACAQPPAYRPLVTAAPANRQNAAPSVSGKVIAPPPYRLGFSLPGTVIDLLAAKGDFVRQGQVIARLDDSAVTGQARRAQADLGLAQAELARLKAGPHPAQLTEAASRVLAAGSGERLGALQATAVAAEAAAAQAQLDYLLAQPLPGDLAVAEAQVQQAQAALDEANALLQQTVLLAPSDGVVVDVLIQAHEYAPAGQAVILLGDARQMLVSVELLESEIGALQPGDPAEITFDALPEVRLPAAVIRIEPKDADKSPGAFVVTLRIADPAPGLRWGMTASVSFIRK